MAHAAVFDAKDTGNGNRRRTLAVMPMTAHAAQLSTVLQNAIAGRYSLPKLDLLRSAWKLHRGIGKPARIALAFLLLAMLPLLFLLSHLLTQLPWPPLATKLVLIVASVPVLAPWITGLMLIGIDAARGVPTGFARLLECYRRIVPLTLVALVICLAYVLGTVLFVLPGLYLLTGCTLALPLVVDAQLSPMQAIKVSLQAIHHRWFDFAAIMLLLLVSMIFSAMCMGLPSLLLLPWQAAVIGVLYCAIFRSAPPATVPGAGITHNDNNVFNADLRR